MTITVNTRFDNNYDKYLMDWYEHPDDNGQFLSFTTRLAMETYDNYQDAVQFILDTPMLCPAYIIIGGINKDEGAVISIGPNSTLENYWDIPHGLPANDTSQVTALSSSFLLPLSHCVGPGRFSLHLSRTHASFVFLFVACRAAAK